MNVSMMQPSFIPWQGYFELIQKSDVFVLLDDFQFSFQSYHQRNRLFINRNKVDWYTVPVDKKNSFKKPLNETRINEKIAWQNKMWKRMKQNYGGTPYFTDIAPFLENWLLAENKSIAVQNINFIRFICNNFGWNRKFVLSSDYPSSKKRSHRVLDLLRFCKAEKYFCAHGSFSYMMEDKVFPVNDIEVLFQNYEPRPYNQTLSHDFIPYLSVLDALFNIGFEATADLIVGGTKHWLTWDDMISMHTE